MNSHEPVEVMTQFATVNEMYGLHVPDRSGMMTDLIPASITHAKVQYCDQETGELMVRFPNNRGVQMFYYSNNERMNYVSMQITFDFANRPRFLLFETPFKTDTFVVQITQSNMLSNFQEYVEMVAGATVIPPIAVDETVFSTFEGSDVRYYIPPANPRPLIQYKDGLLKETDRLTKLYWGPQVEGILDHLKTKKS